MAASSPRDLQLNIRQIQIHGAHGKIFSGWELVEQSFCDLWADKQ
jgi:hypothetical protein